MESDKGKQHVKIYDHMGRPLKGPIPPVKTAKFMRSVFYKGPARVGKFDDAGKTGDTVREELVRAQVPYLVTLLIYHGKHQVAAEEREYFVYAPLEIQKAAELAIRLWQRWERPPRGEFTFGDMREVYPKIGEGVVAEPMSDGDYDEHWKDVKATKGGRFKAAGDPDDPFAFTCLDQDIKLYKSSDFQAGHAHKIT